MFTYSPVWLTLISCDYQRKTFCCRGEMGWESGGAPRVRDGITEPPEPQIFFGPELHPCCQELVLIGKVTPSSEILGIILYDTSLNNCRNLPKALYIRSGSKLSISNAPSLSSSNTHPLWNTGSLISIGQSTQKGIFQTVRNSFRRSCLMTPIA